MEQSSNSLLGKAVRSRRALHVVGNALLQDDGQKNQQENQQETRQADQSLNDQAIGLHRQPTEYTAQAQSPVYPPAQNVVTQQNPSSDAWVPLINPRKLFSAIGNAKKLIGFMSVAGLVAGALYAMSIPKYYYSTAEILIDPRDLQISDRELLPTGLPYDASLALVENQTRILTSRRVILGTVENLNLDQDAEYNGKGLGTPNSLSALKAIIFGRESDDPAKAKDLAVENLLEVTGVSRAPKTFVISLTVRSQDPNKAALIANTMSEVYMDVQDEIQSDTVGRANGELGGRLEELRTDVEKAERLVEAYRSENELFDANGKLISDDEISLSSTQLTRAREKVAELRARADSARELTLDAVLSDALPEGAASNLIAELRRGYAAKVQQRDALSEKLGAQHPQLRTAEAEVTSAQRGIETELRRLSQTAQIELQRAVKTEQDLAAGQARLKSKKSAISESLVRLRELEREAAARRSVYESLLLRARETGEQAGISTANTTIVSQAVPALRPYGTSRKLIAIGGLIAGFMLGVMLALLSALWRAFTIVEPEPEQNFVDGKHHQSSAQTRPQGSVERPAQDGGRPQVYAQHTPDTQQDNLNHTAKNNEGDSMYYPYPAPQHGMMQNGMTNGMMMVPQPVMPQPMMHQPVMHQPMMHQLMMHQPMMQPAHYGYPMMQQPMMQQPMMQHHMMQPPMIHQPMVPHMQPYGYPHPQMMQQPAVQPIYVTMPQPSPAYHGAPAPAAAQQPAPAAAAQTESDYSEIRGRLKALRDGIVNLADGRDRLSRLG